MSGGRPAEAWDDECVVSAADRQWRLASTDARRLRGVAVPIRLRRASVTRYATAVAPTLTHGAWQVVPIGRWSPDADDLRAIVLCARRYLRGVLDELPIADVARVVRRAPAAAQPRGRALGARRARPRARA